MMKKFLFILTLLLLLPGFRDIVEDHQLDAQSTASYGVVVTSLTTSSAGAVTGTPFAVPSSYAAIITWQVVSDSGTLVVNLEGSLDNVSWNTIDTTTASSVRNFGFSAVKFVRCSQASRTGGTSTSCTIVVNRGFINGGNFSLNRILTGDGTSGAPAFSFLSAPTSGWYQRIPNNAFTFSFSGAPWLEINSTNAIELRNDGIIAWSGTTSPFGTVDTTLTRSAAGKVVLSGTTPMLLLGGTTNSFAALKQVSNTLQSRLADDSGLAPISASIVSATQNYQTGNGNGLIFGSAPTVSSGFGTSPTIPSHNGPAAFTINVGTGGVATSGVIGLPTAATGWNCYATDITATAAHTTLETRQTASTTTTATIESQNRATGAATAWAASSILRVACFAF